VGNTELQVNAAHSLRATAYCGTPSFLKIILDKAVEMGLDPTADLALRRAFVAAEMLPEPLRASIQSLGVSVRQGYGTADLGCLGYECSEMNGFHVPDEVILEIVDPTSGRRLPAGEPGEVVATVNSRAYPLLRFGTGDLSALDEATCPCGRTAPRLVRIMGRVGDAVKVRGMFVHPRQLDEVLARFPQVQRSQAIVDRVEHQDVLRLSVELVEATPNLIERLAEAVREVLHVRPDIEVVANGSIHVDAKRLVDKRTWT
jgi:phenylacetate-CoA ligase